MYFKCTKYKAAQGKCPYSAITLNGILTPGTRQHNHEANPGDCVSRDARLQLKEAAIKSEATPTSVSEAIMLKN